MVLAEVVFHILNGISLGGRAGTPGDQSVFGLGAHSGHESSLAGRDICRFVNGLSFWGPRPFWSGGAVGVGGLVLGVWGAIGE